MKKNNKRKWLILTSIATDERITVEAKRSMIDESGTLMFGDGKEAQLAFAKGKWSACLELGDDGKPLVKTNWTHDGKGTLIVQ